MSNKELNYSNRPK